MFLNWKTATINDATVLTIIDRKCFDINWDLETWKLVFETMQVRIGKVENTEVAFWCASLKQSENHEDATYVQVHKLGVHPRFRKEGISLAILRDIWQYAGTQGYGTTVGTQISESLLDPAWADCFIGKWMTRVGFRVADPALVPCDHSLYGKNFAHAVNYTLHQPAFIAMSF